MPQVFICNQNEVDSKLQNLSKTGTSVDGWTDYYLDEALNEEWHLTRYNSEYHGGVIAVLKKIPEPTIELLIDIAMTSTDKNSIIGASLELSERERYKKEDFRTKLIERLLSIDTSKLTDFEKERVKIIVYESNLYDATNRRSIVNKHLIEIQNDADYYRTISEQAKRILTSIDKYSS